MNSPPLLRGLALELLSLCVYGIDAVRERRAERTRPADKPKPLPGFPYEPDPRWLRDLRGWIVLRRIDLRLGLPARMSHWYYSGLDYRCRQARAAFAALPPDADRLGASIITQRRGGTTEWTVGGDRIDVLRQARRVGTHVRWRQRPRQAADLSGQRVGQVRLVHAGRAGPHFPVGGLLGGGAYDALEERPADKARRADYHLAAVSQSDPHHLRVLAVGAVNAAQQRLDHRRCVTGHRQAAEVVRQDRPRRLAIRRADANPPRSS